MKILYAVQATGNGHLSRAMEVTPYLQKFGQVDILLSGNNSTLPVALPVTYRSPGISLFNNQNGGLDFVKIIKGNNWIRAYREAAQLPVEKYDLILNDFEPICARACQLKNKSSVQFSHQASFRSIHTPRPKRVSLIGEWILRNYAPSTHYLGLHFRNYDTYIVPPVIKKSLTENSPEDKGHITVYLFGFDRVFFEKQFHPLPHLHFHCFIPGIASQEKSRNISFYPIDSRRFSLSLLTCHGIITGAGFETPSEALYLGKRLLCIPCNNHYEQYCNAAALKSMGISIVSPGDRNRLGQQVVPWLEQSVEVIPFSANNIQETLQSLMDTCANRGTCQESPSSPAPLWPGLQPY